MRKWPLKKKNHISFKQFYVFIFFIFHINKLSKKPQIFQKITQNNVENKYFERGLPKKCCFDENKK